MNDCTLYLYQDVRSFKDFFVTPYKGGVESFKITFSSPSESVSLVGRVIYCIIGICLVIPVVNLIIFYIAKFFVYITTSRQSPSSSNPADGPSFSFQRDPKDDTRKLQQFFSGGTDDLGRTLDQILAWDDTRLERQHDYIQWLFPTYRESDFNRRAPILNNEIVQYFHEDETCKNNLRQALDRMMRFYGFQKIGEGFEEDHWLPIQEKKYWMDLHDHNQRRISRMIASLSALGLHKEKTLFVSKLRASPHIHASSLDRWR